LLPPISSIFCAALHGESCIAPATAAAKAVRIVAAARAPVTRFITPPSVVGSRPYDGRGRMNVSGITVLS
jgi:hypothetical protein